MIFASAGIDGCFVIDPQRRVDDRGFFARFWCEQEFARQGIEYRIAQINTARTTRAGTVRGLHLQNHPHLEAKVACCTRGAIFDVAVDLRPSSPTFRSWFGVELSAESGKMLYVPTGCAHGYQTLRDDTDMIYLTSAEYAPTAATGVRFDDPAFGIRWPRPVTVISEADRAWPNYRADGHVRVAP
jgi:dTDP-4-dehydrorhamnose 3,5-epimerase